MSGQPFFAPCPTCGRYSHSIEQYDAVAAAFNHFHMMISHRGDGSPTQNAFDDATRDAAQLLTSYVRELEADTLERAAQVARDYANKARNRGWVANVSSAATAADHIATTIRALKQKSQRGADLRQLPHEPRL